MQKLLLISALIILAAWPLTPHVYALGTTVTVTSTSDAGDRNIGDGHCDVSVNVGDQCTLRAAIEEINALGPQATPHRIEFDIPGTGPFTITPTSNFLWIEVPVVIDGATQPGAICPNGNSPANLQIMIDGRDNVDLIDDGFIVESDDITIKGLSIVNFHHGIVGSSNNSRFVCNHIGVDTSGTVALGNRVGIDLWGTDNSGIGGSSVEDRNVISGNGDGVWLFGDFNVVAGNYIGTAADGITPLENTTDGLEIRGDNNTIGGPAINERNVIANNGNEGILISGLNNTIINNYIGVNKNGEPLGNAHHGVFLTEGSQSTIIGNYSAPNLIAHNAGSGIYIDENSEGNALRVNIIRDNGLLGIDLQGSGEASGAVTSNDPGADLDTGANGLQNYPILDVAEVNGRIQGTLNGVPGSNLSLFFYVNENCDDSGHGEGEQFLQAVDVTIPLGNVLDFDIVLNAPLLAGKYVTATAIDIDTENTSEFSNCVQVSEIVHVVNSTSDVSDRNLGDGYCDVSVNVGNQCTLRAAIAEMNASASNGPFHIKFDIPGAGPHVIDPATTFENITKPVVIDGASQPGAYCPIDNAPWLPVELPAHLLIVLDGNNLSSGNGLTLGTGSSGSEIRGLVIGGFPEQGIQVTSHNNLIACNHIGLDVTGTADFGNGLNGIRVMGNDNHIGGSHSSLRNVLSGNEKNGLLLGSGATGNKVQGNFVGSDAAGHTAVGNTESGIRLSGATANRIGGSVAAKGNVIAGNGSNGLHLGENASGNLVRYNLIGLNKEQDPLGNSTNGVFLGPNVTDTQIEDTIIAYNGAAGIKLLPTSSLNSIYANSIFANGELGIDLNGDGLTVNDGLGDPDVGANLGQNFPDMRSANPANGEIAGTMESAPNTEYRLDFYRNDSCDPTEYGEGQEYLGQGSVTTDASGTQTFVVTLGGFELNDFITATATDPDGNTSEFSICVQAGGSPPTSN